MSSKIKTLDDCACGRDYWQYMMDHDIKPEKNGSYYEFYDQASGVYIRFPNCAKTMPKETRSAINAAFVKAGLVLAALVALAWVVL